MNFKYILSILLPFILFNSCYKSTEWEDVTSDYDPVLNVIGIISLDDNVDSFVGVYRTTELTEVSMIFTGIVDTIEWEYRDEKEFWLDSLYEPAGFIDSAIVTISDGHKSYTFNFIEKELNTDPATNWLLDSINVRQYKSEEFSPFPNTTYFLTIEVKGFDPVTGELTTPPHPALESSQIPDILSAASAYEIIWNVNQETAEKGLLTGNLIDSHVRCGGEFQTVIDFAWEGYTVFPGFCGPEEVIVGGVDNESGIQTQNECLCGDSFKIWELGECYCRDNPLELGNLFIDVSNDNPLIAPFGNCLNAINDLGCDYMFPADQISLISICPQSCEINNCSDLLNNEACDLESFYTSCPLTCKACEGDDTQLSGVYWNSVNNNSNNGYCGDGNPDNELLRIRLLAMDDNYYRYFQQERFKEFSNFLFESGGTVGRSVGIEGGFGVFGAFASDTLSRVLSP